VGVLLAELVRGGAAPLEVGLLVGPPPAADALLAALTARYPRVQVWADEASPYAGHGFAPAGGWREDGYALLVRAGAPPPADGPAGAGPGRMEEASRFDPGDVHRSRGSS
jgi:hypothetical protein